MYLYRLISTKYLAHYFLWILIIGGTATNASWIYPSNKTLYFFYVFTKTLVTVILVYINVLLLYPTIFKKQRKVLLFSIFLLLSCVLSTVVNVYIESILKNYYELGKKGDYKIVVIGEFLASLRSVLFSFFLIVTFDFYLQKEKIKKIELEKINAELDLLKAQVNPHFLFNTLNNLYALILQKSDKSAASVLKLADIMKYLLSNGKADKVILQNEIQFLYDYIDLERLRKNDAVIEITVKGNTSHNLITPLLLLPFVENSFKYGLNTVASRGFIKINISIAERIFLMHIENNIPPAGNAIAFHSFGTGIDNTRKRLELLYPGKYELTIQKKTDSFSVTLKLELI
ncbi:MAG: sensor histidine kinase [Panacibacter sp.]